MDQRRKEHKSAPKAKTWRSVGQAATEGSFFLSTPWVAFSDLTLAIDTRSGRIWRSFSEVYGEVTAARGIRWCTLVLDAVFRNGKPATPLAGVLSET